MSKRDKLRQKLASELRQLAQEANTEYLGHQANSTSAEPEQARIQILDALQRDFEASVSAREVSADNDLHWYTNSVTSTETRGI